MLFKALFYVTTDSPIFFEREVVFWGGVIPRFPSQAKGEIPRERHFVSEVKSVIQNGTIGILAFF